MTSDNSKIDIKIMQDAGAIAKDIMQSALCSCVPGISTMQINDHIEGMIKKHNVTGWFREVNNYPYVSCIAVNEVWVHGMPNETKLKKGDVVSVDLGIKLKNHYIDHCWTISVQDVACSKNDAYSCFSHKDKEIEKFLQTGVDALESAISHFTVKNHIGDMSFAMQEKVESEGYSVINGYAGHGIGLHYHEDPAIFCFGTKGTGSAISVDMTVAIEIMYAMGSKGYELADDEWSVQTKDEKISGMFEHTVLATPKEPKILTK